MFLLTHVASAATVCVPELFQHWGCTEAHPDIAAAIGALPTGSTEHEVHVQWDVTQNARVDIPATKIVHLYGHYGPEGSSRPRIGGVVLAVGATASVDDMDMLVAEDANGVVVNSGATLTLTNVQIDRSNSGAAQGGRAIVVQSGGVLDADALTVNQFRLDSDSGAQLLIQSTGTATVRNSTFRDGDSYGGSAIWVNGGNLVSTDTDYFDARSTGFGGGAIVVTGTSNTTITGGRFQGNSHTSNGNDRGGGAIRYVSGAGTHVVEGATFCTNTSAEDGGAIKSRFSTATARRNLFVDNSANDDGDAIHIEDGGITTADSNTFTTAGSDGDSIVRYSGSSGVNLTDNVFANHTSLAVNAWSTLETNLFDPDPSNTGGSRNYDETPTTDTNVEAETNFPTTTCSMDAYRPTCDHPPEFDARTDGVYIGAQWRCQLPDADGDGLMHHEEVARGTDPSSTDSDGDGYSDALECGAAASAPLNNPSFERFANAGAIDVDNNMSIPNGDLYGWRNPSGSDVLLAPATNATRGSWGALLGSNPIAQRVEVSELEDLTLRFHHTNLGTGSGRVRVSAFGQATNLSNLGPGQSRWETLTFQVPADTDWTELQLTSNTDSLVDQIYLGPDNDSDDDGTLDCLDDDSDDDGVLDADELAQGSNPRSSDTDGDGMLDDVDPDPITPDHDDDGLPTWVEEILGSDPYDADSDGDGFPDGQECATAGVINGGFEVSFWREDMSGLQNLDQALVPGWTSTTGIVQIQVAGSSDTAPPASGTQASELNSDVQATYTHTVFLEDGVEYAWVFQHRGRRGDDTMRFSVSDGSQLFAPQDYLATDLAWEERSGVVNGNGRNATFSFESLDAGGVGNQIDGFLVYPTRILTSDGSDYRCLDITEGPDNDGDGDPADCDDSDPTVYTGAPERCFDGTDQDCDGVDLQRWYDVDDDGYGAQAVPSNVADCANEPATVDQDGDCDDDVASINPDAAEVCDGIDQDCDGTADDGLPVTTAWTDADGDGYGAPGTDVQVCDTTGMALQGGDCDDENSGTNPGAAELCNGVDDDCANGIDDGLPVTTYYVDDDDDGYGSAVEVDSCDTSPPTGTAAVSGDCDDDSPLVNPGQTESCNGIDDDCANGIDDGLPQFTYYLDGDGDGYGSTNVESCESSPVPGTVTVAGDCNDGDPAINPDAVEICDDIDNNCNAQFDEGLAVNTYYADADDDGFGDASVLIEDCDTAPPTGAVTDDRDCDDADAAINPDADELCDDVDWNCDGDLELFAIDADPYYPDTDADQFGANVAPTYACAQPTGFVDSNTDCNDALATVHPGLDEVCDNLDNNCNGAIDEAATDAIDFYIDLDGDGRGTDDDVIADCDRPAGYSELLGDCDDANPNVFEGAIEQCDFLDNDCDGDVDEDVAFQDFYQDVDGDGYGDPNVSQNACSPPTGFVLQGGDCDDTTTAINPNAVEVCNGIDDNCVAGEADATDGVQLYRDDDGDGYGLADDIDVGCPGAPGFSELPGDCDDADVDISPAADEVCEDGIDNNCNGTIDADAPAATEWYLDVDADGWGIGAPVYDCASPGPTFAQVPLGDCDDGDDTINPLADELCDGVDNDCDGLLDELDDSLVDVPGTWYLDSDGDGFGDGQSTTLACLPPESYVDTADDCDDSDATVNPNADELCDAIDQNCDGELGGTREGDVDADGDGYGAEGSPLECGGDELVDEDLDCDDGDPSIGPDAEEICDNGIDEDCDGVDLPCTAEVIVDTGCTCRTGGARPWLGMLVLLAGLTRRRARSARG